MAKFEVKYYKTTTDRKKGREPFGTFYPEIEIAEIPESDVEKRAKALLDAKFAACDEVRAIVGETGVLVANIVEEEGEE